MNRFRVLLLALLLAFAAGLFPHMPAHAMAAVAKAEGEAKPAEEATPAPPVDSLGRSSPRGLVEGFLNAIGKEDFEKASEYLDYKSVPKKKRAGDGAALARDLQLLLDKGGWFTPTAMLSTAREGALEKDKVIEEDKTDAIGKLRGNDKEIDIIAEIKSDADGNPIWLISAQTLIQLPDLVSASTDDTPLVNRMIPDFLLEHKWGGAPAGHWIAAILLMAASYVLAWFFIATVVAGIKKIWTKKCSVSDSGAHIMDAIRLPLSLYAAVWVFTFSCMWVGISIIVRQHASQLNVIVAWVSIALLAWRLIDIFAEAAQRKIVANGRFYGISSILFFFRRILKIVFGIILVFIILDNMGVDVTAGLAALGIGGIALALGAQKTLENFIGSLSIVIDQPVHIGDYCKVGDVGGTVEDIGMRSTRLRTNERTLITIPNGDFSNQRIENFARRTRFLVSKKFQLRYDATSEQLRLFMKKFEDILFASEHVHEENLPIRYLGPGPEGHLMETFFYINVSENNEYLKIQQDLMLKIADLMQEIGLYYIMPSQILLPAIDQLGRPSGAEKTAP